MERRRQYNSAGQNEEAGWKLDVVSVWHQFLLCAHYGRSVYEKGTPKADQTPGPGCNVAGWSCPCDCARLRLLSCNRIVGSKTATLSACCNGAPAGIAGGSHVREGSPQQEDPRHLGESQS
jgi:hypothetical protein